MHKIYDKCKWCDNMFERYAGWGCVKNNSHCAPQAQQEADACNNFSSSNLSFLFGTDDINTINNQYATGKMSEENAKTYEKHIGIGVLKC